MKVKSSNELKLVVDGKELDLEKFFKQETEEEAHKADVVDDKVDTKKPDMSETENEEMEEDIVEEGGDEVETENVDKRALIDEVGGILKGKVDDEIIRTIIGKLEKIAYDGSEESKADNEDLEEDADEAEIPGSEIVPTGKEDEEKVENECGDGDKKDVVSKVENAIAKHNRNLQKAYNTASAIIGPFSPFGMDERSMLVRALNHAGIDDVEKATIPEMYAMLKMYNTMTRVDNSYAYNGNGSDEVEINI